MSVFASFIAVCLVVLGSLLAPGAKAQSCDAQSSQTCSAPASAPIPAVLNENDLSLYRRLFADSKDASPKQRQALIEKLKDPLLVDTLAFLGESGEEFTADSDDSAERSASSNDGTDDGSSVADVDEDDSDTDGEIILVGGKKRHHTSRSSARLSGSTWNAGLAAFRRGEPEIAAEHFAQVANTSSSTWMLSAGAFWTARSFLQAGRPEEVTRWLGLAAQYPRTFYGVLASRLLGLPLPFRWEPDAADLEALNEVAESPEGRRVLALVEVGQQALAESTLRAAVSSNPSLARGAMILADREGMANLAMYLEERLEPSNGEYDPAAYPIPAWMPRDGHLTDPALIYALMRQESKFNPRAVSRAGARGVMQLMPSTARFVAARSGLGGLSRGALSDPVVNLSLGQKYVEMLLDESAVGTDLFKLAAAYNGGPGNADRWVQSIGSEDALMFIETIPSAETRDFIERVLSNFWIYRDRLGRSTPSLDALAAGDWPTFFEHDETVPQVAEGAPE